MKIIRKVRVFALLSMTLLGSYGASLWAQQADTDKGFEIAKNLEIFSNVYRNVNMHYVDDVDPGKAIKTAIDAMLASLDPYTNYYPESDIEDVRLQLLGEYGGIGAIILQKEKWVYVSEPYEGFPADQAGLRAGDRIVSINGESAEGKTTAEVSDALRGQAGTTLELVVERDGKNLHKQLTRKAIKFKPVPYFGFVDDGVGYIKLNEFTQHAASDVRDAFTHLRSERADMKGLILDLRGNGGGLLNEAVDIVNLFVKPGELVVETKGKVAAKNMRNYTTAPAIDTDLPIVVLINGYSASASEIVSGSLQDLDRAVVVGSRSYGKGLVQNILPMAYNSQMKVTVSKYYIPSGRCIQAIDYTHRDEEGRASKVPDSLKVAFKTRNGRTVYDGFGIEPDVEVEPQYMSILAMTLVQKNYLFDFANDFVRHHPSIDPPSQFVVTDDIYADFKRFMSDKKYDYATATERVLKELRAVAGEEKYLDSIDEAISSLEAYMKADKERDLDRHRDELSEMLKAELLVRYYYDKGRIEGTLRSDPEVNKAVEVLSDKERYRKILNQ